MSIFLTAQEYNVLKTLASLGGMASVDILSEKTGMEKSTLMSMLEGLGKYVVVERERRAKIELTNEGMRYFKEGLPEEKLIFILQKSGGEAYLENIRDFFRQNELNIALSNARRKGFIEIKRVEGKPILRLVKGGRLREKELLREIGAGGLDIKYEDLDKYNELIRRKLVIVKDYVVKRVKFRDEKVLRAVAHEDVTIIRVKSRLTGDDIVSGAWRKVRLKKYDISAEPPKLFPGRKHFYTIFLEEVRRILLEMGFIEAEGPFVELEFWNFDALFQAQDHPAREIHDSYRVKPPNKGRLPEPELVDKVRMTHENGWTTGSRGWRYKWSAEIARRLVLRSQTTAVSVRYLYKHGDKPVKVFAISRNFRPDVLDPTHSMEFHQCEGIVVGDGLTFSHLLGFLKEFANRLGIEKIYFKPSYFPFTEPSVEGYVYHERLGWIEALPGGMFRPEVRAPLGVKKEVLAWGIGIDRLAMAAMGIDDIRDLFTHDLEKIRNARWLRIAKNRV